jgi:hypothetical protein
LVGKLLKDENKDKNNNLVINEEEDIIFIRPAYIKEVLLTSNDYIKSL